MEWRNFFPRTIIVDQLNFTTTASLSIFVTSRIFYYISP
jgi:hypothetical protein